MEFRIPLQGERADSPPEGYFTCYEAFLVCCRLRFPILEVIVRTMNRFELSISQLNPTGLQQLIGILVLSYEHRLALTADHLEALLKPLQASGPFMYRLDPRQFMLIIKRMLSNGHEWSDYFFFVGINSASIDESCIPIFHSEWSLRHGVFIGYLSVPVPKTSDFIFAFFILKIPTLFPHSPKI